MLTPELVQYINQQRSTGVSDAQIRQNLTAKGWTENDISSVLNIQSTPAVGITSAKMGIIPKIIMFGLGALVITGGAYGYYRYKNVTESTTVPAISSKSQTQNLLTAEKIKSLKTTSNNQSGDYFIGSPEEQKTIVAAFVADNSKSDSTYLYIAANTAYRIGDIKDAGFLFYAAQLRKQFDIKRYGLGKSNGNNIQTYWGFLNETTGQLVNSAVVKNFEIFAEAVDMINRWQVIPSDDAFYPADEYGKYVLSRPTWEATAEAIKQDFKVEFVDVINSWFKTQPALSPANQPPSANDPSIGSGTKVDTTINTSSQMGCGYWPRQPKDLPTTGFSSSTSLPTGYPSDIPLYPQAKVFGSDAKGMIGGFCSADALEKISSYYTSFTRNWTFEKRFADVSQIDVDAQGQTRTFHVRTLLGKQIGGSRQIEITISESGSNTTVIIIKSNASY